MRACFTLSLILSSYLIQGQDTVYLNKNHSEVDKNQAEYYRVIHKGTKVSDLVIKETYFITGKKESEIFTLFDPINKIEDTISFSYAKTWYKNGNLKSLICRRDDTFSDTLKTYWENGSIKRKDFFQEGKLINGHCYDSFGLEINHFDYEIMPQYPGGERNLLSTIGQKIQMPKFIRDNGLKIRVIVRFAIDESGNVTNVSMLEGYNKEVNDAAIEVISQLRKFKPGLVDGVPTKVWYMVPINLSATN
jgi:periplasmic protein TonB